jgi:hypothetical protein
MGGTTGQTTVGFFAGAGYRMYKPTVRGPLLPLLAAAAPIGVGVAISFWPVETGE